MIAIHLGIRAVFNKKLRLLTRGHLATILTTIASKIIRHYRRRFLCFINSLTIDNRLLRRL